MNEDRRRRDPGEGLSGVKSRWGRVKVGQGHTRESQEHM